jgi:hypothetical protein
VRNRLARRIEALGLGLNYQARQRGPVLLQLGDDLEGGVPKDESGLIPRLPVPIDDVGNLRTIQRHITTNLLEHRAQRIHRGGQQLDRIAGNIFGDDPTAPVENSASGRSQWNRPQPVGLSLQLELVVLKDLSPEERSQKHQESSDQDHTGDLGALSNPVGVEPAHASSRMENQVRKVTRIRSAKAAVVSAWSGL